MISGRLMEIYNDYPGAVSKLKKSMRLVSEKYDAAIEIIKSNALR